VELYPVAEFLKYIVFSSNRKGHGIHSPFVFNLIIKVFRNKTSPAVVLDIEKVRRKLTRDDRVISVTDLGAGSKIMKGNLRKVSDIAKYSSVPPKYGRLLTGLASEFGEPGILELGTSLGLSAMYLSAGLKKGKVYTIDACKETLEVARQNFSSSGFKEITVLNGSFDEMIPVFRETNITPGIVFVDGDHTGESVLRYYEKIRQFSGDNTVLIFDDIHCSREMGEAWKKIKRDEEISITIDLYRFGIVFFRKGMTRMDYVIGY
jgi:predicted O-methyltransferase YrrM